MSAGRYRGQRIAEIMAEDGDELSRSLAFSLGRTSSACLEIASRGIDELALVAPAIDRA